MGYRCLGNGQVHVADITRTRITATTCTLDIKGHMTICNIKSTRRIGRMEHGRVVEITCSQGSPTHRAAIDCSRLAQGCSRAFADCLVRARFYMTWGVNGHVDHVFQHIANAVGDSP